MKILQNDDVITVITYDEILSFLNDEVEYMSFKDDTLKIKANRKTFLIECDKRDAEVIVQMWMKSLNNNTIIQLSEDN